MGVLLDSDLLQSRVSPEAVVPASEMHFDCFPDSLKLTS